MLPLVARRSDQVANSLLLARLLCPNHSWAGQSLLAFTFLVDGLTNRQLVERFAPLLSRDLPEGVADRHPLATSWRHATHELDAFCESAMVAA